MAGETDTAPLRVCCECGKWVPVTAGDAGSAVKCSCGRRVEVPLLEVFRDCPDLLSATTVESRIHRLIARGELPLTGRCARCGDVKTEEVVVAQLDCERYTVHRHGGARFLYIPFLFWILWQEEERVEVRGHDTVVPAPVCLCKRCQDYLRGRPRSMKIGIELAILFSALGGLAAYFNVAAGCGVATIGLLAILIGFLMQRYLASRARQRTLKNLLGQVPVYRQILASYPDAIVVIPPASEL